MQNAWGTWALAIVAFGVFTIGVIEVKAVDLDEWRRQFEERRAARRAEIEDKLSNNESTPTPSPSVQDEETPEEPVCDCSASVDLNRPDVRWNNGVLEIVPRFDLSIRVKGEEGALPWNLALTYNGQVEEQNFSGGRTFGAQCFDARQKYTGISGQPVAVSSILRNLFGVGSEAEVPVRLEARVSGCDSDSEEKQATIEIADLGNLKIGRWKTIR